MIFSNIGPEKGSGVNREEFEKHCFILQFPYFKERYVEYRTFFTCFEKPPLGGFRRRIYEEMGLERLVKVLKIEKTIIYSIF